VLFWVAVGVAFALLENRHPLRPRSESRGSGKA
jgi:hypothetical protein